MKKLTRVGATVLGAFAAVVLLASPAVAAPPASIIHTDNEAGYNATASAAISNLTGELAVPTVTCPVTGSVTLISELYLRPTTTTESGLLGWNDTCTNGTLAAPYAFADVDGANASINISPGDILKLSVVQKTLNGPISLSINDTTNSLGATVTAAINPSFTLISALTFASNGGTGNISPIPTFTPVRFNSLKVNGATLSTYTPSEYEMYDGSTLQIATSAIGSNGTFTTTFKHM